MDGASHNSSPAVADRFGRRPAVLSGLCEPVAASSCARCLQRLSLIGARLVQAVSMGAIAVVPVRWRSLSGDKAAHIADGRRARHRARRGAVDRRSRACGSIGRPNVSSLAARACVFVRRSLPETLRQPMRRRAPARDPRQLPASLRSRAFAGYWALRRSASAGSSRSLPAAPSCSCR